VVARTLDDLAELTGVSRATVSRVINGGPVAESTRLRVREILERENYRPNLAARSLARGRSGVVGVVMHLPPGMLFQDPYFSQLLQGMSDVLAEREAGMMLWLGNRSKQETLGQIQAMNILDGLIVTANFLEDPLVDGLLASQVPTVLIGHRRDDLTASYVDVDNMRAAETVTAHLLQLGRRRVGHISGTRHNVAGDDRLTGYQNAMRAAGLPATEFVFEGDFNDPSGAAGAAALLDRGVDAIFCANDRTARGALEVLHARGVRVPDDVALAGFDDLEFAAHLDPPLTTIRQGVDRQGAEAARTLLKLLQDPAGGPRRVLLPAELVIRQSTVGQLQQTTGGGPGS
jgi:DNA-binding LacI/PurR family transcriptional regulator